ncbi:MAG: Fic family protein [Coprothermobacterota bacterium]|nr:Fic family protein [Coprothermobacterota bacterium]
MVFDSEKPFNDLPLLPPRFDLETKAILKKTIMAGRVLAELKGLGKTIPNQALLVDSLILQEAKSSSEIENIITTHDALFKAFAAKTSRIDPSTKEVLRYREALWEGFNELKKKPILSTNLFLNIVQTINGNQAGIRHAPGTAIINAITEEVIYTPAEGEEIIRDKLKNLEEFIHADDSIDPLIKLAVIHYQLEAIHPFSDGNGRTGRIINILFLVLRGLLDLPVLYLSKFIIDRKNEYYLRLRQVTESNSWEAWILYMLEAVESTAAFTRDRMITIRELMSETMERARKGLPTRVYSKELIELLFRQPYTKGQFLVDSGIAKRQTAAEYLRELEKLGILKPHKIGKEVLYLNVELYDLLSR